MNLEQLLSIAVSAACDAGKIIMEHYQSADYKAWDKSPDNPVTTADLAADQFLRRQLMAAAPHCGWLSEETADTPERLEKSAVWVVDPIDGTKEFIKGINEFSVSVGFSENGKPLVGVIHNPAADEIMAGIVGQGITYDGKTSAQISQRTESTGARVLVSNTEFQRGIWEPYKNELDLRSVGSTAYKLARIAAGFGDAYITLKPKSEWDICAGVALILAAGGRVTDLDGKPLCFNQKNVKVSGVVAANPVLHTALMELLKSKR